MMELETKMLTNQIPASYDAREFKVTLTIPSVKESHDFDH